MAMQLDDSTLSSSVTTPAINGSSADDGVTTRHASETPPSLSDDVISSLHRKRSQAAPSNAATEFLSDLNNYLALGCLVCEDYVDDFSSTARQGEPGWEDVSHAPPLYAFDSTLSSNLSRLATAGWIKIQRGRSVSDFWLLIYRIYVLPGDAGLRFVDRQNRRLVAALESLVAELFISPETWQGRPTAGADVKFDAWATCEEGSLFYMFNKLPSPSPDISLLERGYTREALEDLLKSDSDYRVPGLKAELYPYQRRSAGLMLQRESVAKLELDPRLERRVAPDGSVFYYGSRDQLFLRNPRYYESCRGGILAETMGLGKTLICLALILATRHHFPKVPAAFERPPIRPVTASLADMCISNINRKSVPWKVEFERIRCATKDEMSSCVERLESNPPVYEIPVEPARWNRKTVIPPPKKVMLAATSIIVVPRNLCKQWHSEIQKHVEEGGLNILVMEDLKKALPPPEELRTYDVVLFSRNRFEMECKDGADDRGRRIAPRPPTCRCQYIGASRTRDCHCIKAEDLYTSPLRSLHFKRIIIDEGHFFSATNTTAVGVANKLVTADHRWVVSGTPAKDLLGVEVDMSAAQNMWQTPVTKELRDAVLDQRRHFSAKEDTAGAVKSLGSLASHFLKIRPWCTPDSSERPATWDEYIYRHEAHRRKTFSGFSTCLRRTIEAMVVKTQPEDVERDIALPPLSHEVIRLEPSFYDKLTANLFTLVLTANAVTSERTDADYLFHKNSAKARYQLVANLRQSAFFWTGFSEEDVLASKKNGTGYLEKPDAGCTEEDRQLLTDALATADQILASEGWKALSQSHEIGLFVQDWPVESAEYWSFVKDGTPILTGISQLLEAQKHVHERIGSADPGEGLAGVGLKSISRAREARMEDDGPKKANSPVLTKSGVPTSSLSGEPALKRRSSGPYRNAKRHSTGLQQSFRAAKRRKQQDDPPPFKLDQSDATGLHTQVASLTDHETSVNNLECADLPEDSPYAQSEVIGTTSAKLSYLITQILIHYETEKILVFYDGENSAYYLSQVLELLHIKHEIYAKSLAASLKSEYVVRFNEEPQERVLLMDVKQAAYGLNLSSASRVYFINPVCRPNTEAQAIKRAHRIGQTRKVFVETLLLKGTIEEKMYERAKRMTRLEHQVSHVEDDGGMQEIIQSARVLPVTDNESRGTGQMAPLAVPQRLWGRPGFAAAMQPIGKKKRDESSSDGGQYSDSKASERPKKAVRKDSSKLRTVLHALPYTAPSEGLPAPVNLGTDELTEDDEPIMHRWRRESQSQNSPLKSLENPMLPTMTHPDGVGLPFSAQPRLNGIA